MRSQGVVRHWLVAALDWAGRPVVEFAMLVSAHTNMPARAHRQ
jgi:hypothetical protein